MIVDGIDYGLGFTKATGPGDGVQCKLENGEWFRDRSPTFVSSPLAHGVIYRRPMTQAEKAAEAGKAPGDQLVTEVMQTLDRGGWNRDLATRIIEIVRAHDAKDRRALFARGFRAGCGANVSDEIDLLRKLRAEWEEDSKPAPDVSGIKE